MHTHILWDNGNGTAALWRLVPSESEASGPERTEYVMRQQFGPFAGWTARDLAVGPDGQAYLLWTGRDQTVSIWRVDLDGGEVRHWKFGPYREWEARALAIGPDDVLRVLWAGAEGAAALWSLREGETPESLDCGPFAGWTAAALAVGPDNRAHLLWVREDGCASVWLVGADGVAHQTQYGPYDGWSAVAVAAGRDGASRLLWKSAGGYVSLWDLPDGGGILGMEDQRQTVHGPFSGWTSLTVALDADDAAYLLWRYDGGGLASVWRADAAGEFTHTEYGPYAGWVPVALRVGP